MRTKPLVLSLLLTSVVGCGGYEDPTIGARQLAQSKAPPELIQREHTPTRMALFGDLHIHTSLSSDAYVMGVRAMPDDAYRFAKGHTIHHASGQLVTIDRPLDFAAVTDHSEYLGQARVADLDIPLNKHSFVELMSEGSRFAITRAWIETMMFQREAGFGFGANVVDESINLEAWHRVIHAAEEHNEPGRFTTFVGYEWSSDGGDIAIHLHRNVVFGTERVAARPFSSVDSDRPEDLWAFLAQENADGRPVIAISHNANQSKGLMFKPNQSDGRPFDASYAQQRNQYEPLSEILQIKGSSATHPLLSPLDEFADFEIAGLVPATGAEDLEEVKGGYMRDALRTGLEHEATYGFNAFQFGVIGSSDSHNASSPAEESSYHGKLPMLDGSAGLRTDEATLLPSGTTPVTKWGSGGLAGVWAENNTRAAIFEALQRRETFATSGPRMTVRLFGSWDYTSDLLDRDDFLRRAYADGVPMGGELLARPNGGVPGFLVSALKDPLGANLDRLQIVKGWADTDGTSHEKVFDVAWSPSRQIVDGRLQPVGNTVDAEAASYTNTIGAEALSVFWQDPEFDPDLNAFYYARVLQIPTPRWSTYDAKRLSSAPMEPVSIQERAISSAIWYRP